MTPDFILATAPGVGPHTHKKLRAAFASSDHALRASRDNFIEAGITARSADALIHWRSRTDDHERLAEELTRTHIRLITMHDDEYPSLLREITLPPAYLFLKGATLRPQSTVALVGTRHPTAYGSDAARILTDKLKAYDIRVVSGLAFGIDEEVHNWCIARGLVTVAVLGRGILVRGTTREESLADRIVRNGGTIMSEFPPHMEANKKTFPIRNRIIAGMAELTVVLEALLPSGSLDTVKHATSENRDVGAVPGPITSLLSAGPLHLLKDGAHVITSPDDIIHLLKGVSSTTSPNTPHQPDPLWRIVQSGQSLDDFIRQSKLSPAAATQWLMKQELQGKIALRDGRIMLTI